MQCGQHFVVTVPCRAVPVVCAGEGFGGLWGLARATHHQNNAPSHWGITCTAHTPRAHCARATYHVGANYGEKVIPWFLVYSMLTYGPHSESEMTVAGTLSPFDWVWATVMPTGSHERDIGETVRGHSAVCAMVITFTAWKYMHFTVE